MCYLSSIFVASLCEGSCGGHLGCSSIEVMHIKQLMFVFVVFVLRGCKFLNFYSKCGLTGWHWRSDCFGVRLDRTSLTVMKEAV